MEKPTKTTPFEDASKLIVSSERRFNASAAYYPAGPDHYGFINPHVTIFDSCYEGKIAFSILRKNFAIGDGPEKIYQRGYKELSSDILTKVSRGWKSIVELCEEMPFEEALKIAEDRAKRDNVLLYDHRTMGCTLAYDDPKRLLWIPENWRAIVG